MSQATKAQARDKRYGRRGGRWANDASGRVDDVLAELHKTRLAALRHDMALTPEEYADPRNRQWPAESVEFWRAIANDDGHPLHPLALDVVEIVGPMNALTKNLVVCADPSACCQPGTVPVVVAVTNDYGPVVLEFCVRHAVRQLRAKLTRLDPFSVEWGRTWDAIVEHEQALDASRRP